MCKIIFHVLIFVILPFSLLEAQTIELFNPSFEGTPAASTTPDAWYDCGRPGQSPPDIQPNGTFKVVKPAYDGKTYLGMVTRETDTWEAVGQRLKTSLEGESCYYFSLYLARSESYLSRTRIDTVSTQFTQPIRLRIWAGGDYCEKREMLAETSLVEHTDWQIYKFKFTPRRDYRFIILEAFYMTPTLISYNGNILIDNCSLILAGPCEDEEFSDYQKYSTAVINGKEDSILSFKATGRIEYPIEVKTPLTMWELDREFIRKGQIIRIYNLYTSDNITQFSENSYRTLDNIYDFLIQVPSFSIEIGGHEAKTRNKKIDYDDMSLLRAEAVAEYLIDKGIDEDRIISNGYGIKENLTTNRTRNGREENRRIEIKFTSVD